MAMIYTTKGMMDEAKLVKTTGFVDNDNEYTTWQEWRLDGELVKREAQIGFKKGIEMSSSAGKVGG